MSLIDPTPAEIQAVIEADTPIPCRTIEQWMESDNIEVLGAVYDLLTIERASRRIEPSFQFEQFPAFLLRYMERCLRESPESEWAHNASVGGMELVAYYQHLWRQKEIRRQEFAKLKEWLARLYQEGNPELQTRVVQAVLEHLFEEPEIADYFEDWQRDPILKPAYRDAMQFATWMRNRRRNKGHRP